MGVLPGEEHVAHIVPGIGLDAGRFRFGCGPLEGFQGVFSLPGRGQGQAAVHLQLAGFSSFPARRRPEQAVREREVAVDHGLGSGHGLFLAPLLPGLGGRGFGHQQQSEGESHAAEAKATSRPSPFHHQQEEADEKEGRILVAVVGVGDGAALTLLHAVEAGEEGGEVHKSLVGSDIGSLTSLGHGDQHALVEGGHHRLSGFVCLVALGPTIPVILWNGPPGFRRHTDGVHGDAPLSGFRGPRKRIVLVVFAIGQDQHHTARLAFRIEGVHGQGQRSADSGPLQRDGFRPNRVEKELDGGQVLSEGRLHIGLSSKHDESNPVPVELLDDPLDAALGQIQTGHAHIFREHRSADVERNHDVHTLRFHLLHAGAPFGVHQAHGQQGDAGPPDQEFPDGPAGAGIGPKRPAEFQFGGFGHPSLFPTIMASEEQQPDRRHQQSRPSSGVMQVELGGHLPQKNGEGDHA